MSKEKDTNERQEGARVYELGFHFVPTLSEDEVAVQFSHLKSLIEKKGGTFIAEATPEMTDLAYELTKTTKAQKKRYTEAYFGWVKFELNAEEVSTLEKEVKAFEPILRYLLITTVRENTLVGSKESSKKQSTKETPDAETPAPAEAPAEEVQVG